jgi:titin
MSNLKARTDYWFRVRGENGGKAGAWSAALKVRTPDPVVPTEPLNPIVDTITRAGFRVDWDAPAYDGDAAITDFRVEVSSDGGTTWAAVPHVASTATSLTVGGLAAATDYLVRVAAVNVAGVGAFTAPVAARTSDPVVASAPLNLVVDTVTWVGFRVDWDGPVSNGGSPVTDFTVQVSSNRGVTWTTVPHVASSATSLSVSGLAAGTEYLVRVAAVNAVGTGPFTATRTVRTQSTSTTRPSSLTSRRLDPTTLSVSWRRPSNLFGQPVLDYLLEVSANRGATWVPVPHVPSTSLSMTVSGLAKGVTYLFRGSAVTPVGNGAVSSTHTTTIPTTRPAAPTGLAVVDGSITRASVQLGWSAPVDTGGRPITDYTIETSRNGGRTWTVLRKPASTARSITITGLLPGTAYQVRVKAKTSVGTSTTGPTVALTTLP